MAKKLYYVAACKYGHLSTGKAVRVPGVYTNKREADKLLKECEKARGDYMFFVSWQWLSKDGRNEIDRLMVVNVLHSKSTLTI